MKNMKLKVLLALCALLLLSAFIAERKEPITIFMIGDSTMANKSLKNGAHLVPLPSVYGFSPAKTQR